MIVRCHSQDDTANYVITRPREIKPLKRFVLLKAIKTFRFLRSHQWKKEIVPIQTKYLQNV